MGLSKTLFEEQQKQLEIDRAEMEKRNLVQMEELAKLRPEPSIAEVQAATTPRRAPTDAHPPVADMTPPAMGKGARPEPVVPEPVVEKVSEPVPAETKGGYQTRQSKAKS